MTARILVVEDENAAARLMEARLTAEYFEVVLATSGREALRLLGEQPFDLVVLDILMPEMDGFEVCRRVKADAATCHLPVLMVTALHNVMDRVLGLEAGADDFLMKPVGDVALISRVKNLVRLKLLADELHLRAATYRKLGLEVAPLLMEPSVMEQACSVLALDDLADSFEQIRQVLGRECTVDRETDPVEALRRLGAGSFELVLIDLHHNEFDTLRLCSLIRSTEGLRMLPIVVIADEDTDSRLARAFEIGVNDYLTRPIEPSELLARVRTQIRRKRYLDRLRSSVRESIELSVVDPLTGLYNRRYLEAHLKAQIAKAKAVGHDLSVMIIDIDYFKAVNDTFGHDAGDLVLKHVADEIRANLRSVDLCGRIGGEEFLVVMPDTDRGMAQVVAERIRERVSLLSITLGDGRGVAVTCSIGIAMWTAALDRTDALLKRADQALYCAKNDGRNRVASEAA